MTVPPAAPLDLERAVPRFYFIVRDAVCRYRADMPVAWDFWAELYMEPDAQYSLGSCGHSHREPDKAEQCGQRMLARTERGIYPRAFCRTSKTWRHLYRSSDECIYCGKTRGSTNG